jgi:acetyl esterase/lipase
MIHEHLILDEWNPSVYMTTYIPDLPPQSFQNALTASGQVLRNAIIICSGGGYLGFNEQETEHAALQFLAAGCCAFVLRYSVGAGQAALPAPISDLAKTIALVRQNATQWGINSESIHVLGFSTGAHLALMLGATWHEPWLSQMTGLTAELMRPNGLILGYPIVDLVAFENHLQANFPEQLPLIPMIYTALFHTPNPTTIELDKWDFKNLISSQVPPTLLWQLDNDKLLPENSLSQLHAYFNQHDVACIVRTFEGTGHGSGLIFDNHISELARFIFTVLKWLSEKQHL